METICLVKEQPLNFSGDDQTREQLFIARKSDATLKTDLSDRFSGMLYENVDQMNRDLDVTILLPEVVPGQDSAVGSMKLEADYENHVLTHILETLSPEHQTLSWHVKGFGYKDSAEQFEETSWMVKGIDILHTRRLKTLPDGSPSHPRSYLFVKNFPHVPPSIIAAWKNKTTFIGTFSVFLCISESPNLYQVGLHCEHLLKCRKMFEESIGSDVELRTREGSTIKCHKGMLSASSDKLAEIFERQKWRTQFDFMRRLSSDCIRKLLAYIYYTDVSFVGSSISFALEVLKAATEFQLPGLILQLQKYLLQKSAHEFNENEAVKLIVITKMDVVNKKTAEVSDHSDDEDDSNSGHFNGTEVTRHLDDTDDNYESTDEDDDTRNDDRSGVGQNRRGVKRIYEQTNDQRKRNRVGYKGVRETSNENVAGCSDSLAIASESGMASVESGNASQMNETEIPSRITSSIGITTDDVYKYRDLLEKQTLKVVKWRLDDDREGLLKSTEFRGIKTVKLAKEIAKCFARCK